MRPQATSSPRGLLAAASLGLLVAATGGCKQNEGDRCQLDSDCAEGYSCCILSTTIQKQGTCQTAARCGTVADLGPDTGGSDFMAEGGSHDAKGSDKKKSDGGSIDSASADTFTADTKAAPDTKPTPDTKAAPDTQPVPDVAKIQ
jgi:hypothetical protein